MQHRSAMAVMFTAGLACACGLDERPPPPRAGATITERTADRLVATYAAHEGVVEIVASRTGAASGTLALTVNDKSFWIEGNVDLDHVVLDGGGHTLDSEDSALLGAMAEPLMQALGVADDNDLLYFERLPLRNALYLASSPRGFVHDVIISSGKFRSLADDGVQRLRKWTLYSGVYDRGYEGRVYSFKATTWKDWGVSACGGGNYGCMGRCGSGCGGLGTNYPYRDCLEHDVCSHNLCAVAGAASVNCGDEYRKALNDFNAN